MSQRQGVSWIIGGVLAALILSWALPRAFPLTPRQWEVSKEEAQALALARLADLGELPARPYSVVRLKTEPTLEVRLQEALATRSAAEVRAGDLGRSLEAWEVTIHDRTGAATAWRYRALIAVDGGLLELRAAVPPDEAGPPLDPGAARREADRFLVRQGFDLSGFAEPELRSRQLQQRTDRVLRYPRLEPELGPELPHGVEVTFAGDRLIGFHQYLDDPSRATLKTRLRPLALIQQAWIFLAVPLLPFIAVPFVRRYHAGEIGVRRGLEIAGAVLAAGLVVMVLVARAVGAELNIGVLTRPQVTWIVFLQFTLVYYVPLALITFLSWSVGESLCREKWSEKLAAFDALCRGKWLNRTFAAASLRGLVGGLALAAVLALATWGLRDWGLWAPSSIQGAGWWYGVTWFSIPLVLIALIQVFYAGLFGRLLLLTWLRRRIGAGLGTAVAVVGVGLLFFPLVVVFPMSWGPVFWIAEAAALAFLFLRFGLWTSMLAHLVAAVVSQAGFLLAAPDPSLRFQAGLAVFAVASPCLVSLRFLWSKRVFVYRYEDIPPHVRRIADRERQKVELETARRIQTSILPDLPPELNGVEMAHTYLPATEVGGDFYDVLALEDGRLAVAVGDVAGHGVSSGLVMSMAKSALAVQVSFDPEVEAVFATLNRMVFQSARKRLLATLCYALLDPERREMFYASAGHLFPYRISLGGEVEALESVSYPLGVRSELTVRVRSARLDAGDYLVLFSDGVVEARRPESDEPYGFDRLEQSLRRHAGGSVGDLRRGVLADLEDFTVDAAREDDLTLLVLRLP